MNRRSFMQWGSAVAGAALVTKVSDAHAAMMHMSQSAHAPASMVRSTAAALGTSVGPGNQRAVVTPNGSTLPWRVIGGVKVGHLVAEPVEHSFLPGIEAACWGYNGGTPGPTIEAVEGDHLRIYVTNRLPEPTTVHWHGIILPNGMDGMAGLNQPAIAPSETFVYEFTVNHAGTFMYHPHYDEMTQIALGMAGMFIVHPRQSTGPTVHRDFALITHEWALPVGARRPNPNEMTEFNILTFNSKSYPATQPLLVQRGERVRIRFGNLSPMDHHPIHLHGVSFKITGTDGGSVPETAQIPQTTVLVPVGATRAIEFVPTVAGDWAMHCHMTHHVMTQMGHNAPSMVGVDAGKLDQKMGAIIPEYMTMGTEGMGGMGDMRMAVPANSAPMRGGSGPFGAIDMGGMFSILKVRDNVKIGDETGWYKHPANSVAHLASPEAMAHDGIDSKKSTG